MNEQKRTERLIAACWSMYIAIQMAVNDGAYLNSTMKTLASVADDAMHYAGQIEKEVQTNE